MDFDKIPSQKYSSTLERGMRVLRAFQSTDNGLSNQELAERTGIPKSTISRLTYTLQQLGFLSQAGRKDKFRPGPGLIALGRVANDSMPFVRDCAPVLQKISDETDSLVLMTAREGLSLMILAVQRPGGKLIRRFDVGHILPMLGSSAGHVYLAAMRDSEFDALLSGLSRLHCTPAEAIIKLRCETKNNLFDRGFYMAPGDTYFDQRIMAVALPMFSRTLAEPVIISAVVSQSAKSDTEMLEVIGPKIAREMNKSSSELSFVTP